MPIKVDNALPARALLEKENVFVMTEDRAMHQDIRPLKILLLNLMPTKIETETQLLRLLGNSPLQVDIELMHMATHQSRNTSAEHLLKFYKTFEDIKNEKFDGMIVTGAPVEHLPFEEVDYWPELCSVFEWAKTNVYSTFNICWGAQASLYFHYGVQKYNLNEKMFGVFEHRSLDTLHPLMRCLDEVFYIPHSRHTDIHMEDIAKVHDLQVLSYSDAAGIYLLSDMACRNFFATGHAEYDADTLAKEYFRDKNKRLPIAVPCNYFPDDDPEKTPLVRWRSAATLLFTNWLNYFVYQQTPYDLSQL
ncbi:MAG: homoserine O-succinyltransferase [Oscillospiraceae bacterium]|jgi:homoserine O-succinyltransferase|nr:homoserine O-succinyltransferase [Oscillospiraceae bacterium]